jgi:hypothetical protein
LRSLLLVVLLMLGAGCVALAAQQLDEQYGTPVAKEFTPLASPAVVSYEKDIQPLMEKRCLVCHGCYDAPCQLKLDSYEGLLRGASQDSVYDSLRLTPADPSRLFEDAHTTLQWRERNFFPVLNERGNDSAANLQAGLLARTLDLKQQHPLPADKILPDRFDFSLGRAEQCPRIEEFDGFAAKNPEWGMPYGLPALEAGEHDKLMSWLAAGAPAEGPTPLSAALTQELTDWETLFNGDDTKGRLVARYLYEHLFLAHLYFEDRGMDTVFFKLVRSRTPPGQPIDIISTRRPYDDPQVERVYYRLWRDPTSVIAKTHMPYRLTPTRRDQWRQWFIDADYAVAALPGYDVRTASNPFSTYQDIPYQSRYRFLLDEAQFTIMNFIKGPVCRGNVALDVIQDRFWVFFTSPESAVGPEFAKFLAREGESLKLPAEAESGIWSAASWRSFANAQRSYVEAKGDFIRANADAFLAAGLNTFWNGDGKNRNAALTVFRHYDSASVVQGMVGTPPQTAWLIDYPILERIHYLLVAGFDVYGTASHQAMTRMYMDFLRMESEMNFIGFLPQATRKSEVDNWYRGAEKDVSDYLNAYFEKEVLPPPFPATSDDPKAALFAALRDRMAPILNQSNDLSRSGLSDASIAALKELDSLRGTAASILPQVTLIDVEDHGPLTLLSNSAYSNIASMFGAANRRLPNEDSVTLANGVVGAYPNVFLSVREVDLPELVTRIQQLRNEADYSALLDRFGVRRTDSRFWASSDDLLSKYRQAEPLTSGVLDYSRYDNR